jgi:hypothetical protein
METITGRYFFHLETNQPSEEQRQFQSNILHMVQHKQEKGQVIYLSRSKPQASTPEEPPSATRGVPCSENRRP